MHWKFSTMRTNSSERFYAAIYTNLLCSWHTPTFGEVFPKDGSRYQRIEAWQSRLLPHRLWELHFMCFFPSRPFDLILHAMMQLHIDYASWWHPLSYNSFWFDVAMRWVVDIYGSIHRAWATWRSPVSFSRSHSQASQNLTHTWCNGSCDRENFEQCMRM